MTLLLAPDSKFACIAIEDASVVEELQGPIGLEDGLWVLTRPPFEVDDTWRNWLGSIQADHYSGSNLLLFATAPSNQPQVVDRENIALEERAYHLFYAVLLHGVPALGAGLVLGGAKEKDTIVIRRVGTLETHFYNGDAIPARLDRDTFESAAVAAQGIRGLYGDMNAPQVHQRGPGTFRRLRRGFSALLRGFREEYGDDRLHQFVRSLEAVVMPSVGKTRRQFVHRCQVFAGNSKETRDMLEELYELRSTAEHMNDWQEKLGGHADPAGMASLRSFQAEVLASEVYLRMLKDSPLRARFATDGSVADLWSGADHQLREIWGKPLDLAKKVGTRYRRPFLT